jgi:hypothetical protein
MDAPIGASVDILTAEQSMRVRKGGRYVFWAEGLDRFDPAHKGLVNGEIVRVVHPHGCPPPNTMGHCHVENEQGEFMGLVWCGSLNEIPKGEK